MAVSIFVINSNSQEELPPLEDCRLYRVNITELLSKPDVLSDVSDGEINREMLKIMAANRRHELYVLLGPVVNWDGDTPIIYSGIQYLKYKKEVVCAMIKWLNDYEPIVAANIFWSHPQLFSLARNNFKKWLSGDLNSVDHSFAARILEMEFYSCRSPILKERPWNEVEDRIIVAINRGAPVSLEVMDPVIRKVADIYFNAVLPIMLSEVDRSLLLLRGLQFRPTDEIMRIMNLSEEDIRQSLGKTLATAFDYVYGLLPEVVD